MIYSLRFLPELEEDVFGGFAWYEQKATGLGEDFLRLFYACSEELPRNPFLYPKIHREFRRRLLRRFPYSIYYRVIDYEVVILGLFHCARDPINVLEILDSRSAIENP